MSPPRKRSFLIITALCMTALFFALFEILSYFIIVKSTHNHYLPKQLKNPEIAQIQTALEKRFSPELGWEPRPPNSHGYRGPDRDIRNALISLFGDSFTFAYHPDIEQSWPRLLEKMVHRPVLNFGVPGYGTDQAYLRFEKYSHGEIKTPYVFLGILSENIARIQSRNFDFYYRSNKVGFTKPRFIIDHRGKLVLLPNPLKSPAEVRLLYQPEFLRKIGAQDYWYQFYEGYGMNRRAHFPYSLFMIQAAPFYLSHYYKRKFENFEVYKLLYQDEAAMLLMEKIIIKFVQRAKENGATPLVFFFPTYNDIVDFQKTGKTVYEPFYRRIKGRYDATLNAMDYFEGYLDQVESPLVFFISIPTGNGHYTPFGERIVAEGFFKDLKKIDRGKNF
jgi:hypothetical protein